jgi:hypothetical protein
MLNRLLWETGLGKGEGGSVLALFCRVVGIRNKLCKDDFALVSYVVPPRSTTPSPLPQASIGEHDPDMRKVERQRDRERESHCRCLS